MGKPIKDKSNPQNLEMENRLIKEGYQLIAGIDEAGRGPFAGPVVAASAIMPIGFRIDKLTDSKQLPKTQHTYFAELVQTHALSYGIGIVDVEEFDAIGHVVKATRLAMKRAVEQMKIQPDYLLVDGREQVDIPIPQESVIKGDYMSHSISSAAILAKVYRDDWMKKIDKELNGRYQWSANAGYLTKGHVEAIQQYGLSKYHRKSWVDVCKRFE